MPEHVYQEISAAVNELLTSDLYEQAQREAAELVGSNSYEYDGLVESIYERLCACANI